jgi:hypothetical protein
MNTEFYKIVNYLSDIDTSLVEKYNDYFFNNDLEMNSNSLEKVTLGLDDRKVKILDLFKNQDLNLNLYLELYITSKNVGDYICLYIVSIHFELKQYEKYLLIKIINNKYVNKKILDDLIKILPKKEYQLEISDLIKKLKGESGLS